MLSLSPIALWHRLRTGLSGPPLRRGHRALTRGKPTKAAAIWHEAALAGDIDCQLALAEALWNGHGVLRDARAALRWYESAAEAGLPLAQARLAGVTAMGIGDAKDKVDGNPDAPLVVPRDRVAARAWALRAAKQDYVEAQVLLAWLLCRDDDETTRDVAQAIDWYGRAIDAGSSAAMVGLAGLISAGEVPGQGPEDAYQLYRRAAELGNKTGYYYVGANLVQGVGVEPDFAEGRKWLLRAAEEGVVGAMRSLGLVHLRGMGGSEVDLGQAETWFRRGAVKGDVESMVLLADLHSCGLSGIPNVAEAILWYVAASETGHAPALTALGIAHLTGKGVEQDPVRAVGYFEQAAAEHVEARYQLGLCHLLGRGVPVNHAKAAEHLLAAAEQKHPDATYNYGTLLYHGNGVAQDRAAALAFYSHAAELGSVSGQFRMAHAYTLGNEVPANPERAIELFIAAAEQNHVAAQVNLARMLLKHRPSDRAALEKWRDRLRKPAKEGVVEAITVLAELRWRMDQDVVGALELLKQSTALGDPMARYVREMIEAAVPEAKTLWQDALPAPAGS